MKNTIKLLKILKIFGYIFFVEMIVALIWDIVYAIILVVMSNNPIFFLIILCEIPIAALLFFTKYLIGLIDGSIAEHARLSNNVVDIKYSQVSSRRSEQIQSTTSLPEKNKEDAIGAIAQEEKKTKPNPIEIGDTITIIKDLDINGFKIPKGTQGTVDNILIYYSGMKYVIKINSDTINGLFDLNASDIKKE